MISQALGGAPLGFEPLSTLSASANPSGTTASGGAGSFSSRTYASLSGASANGLATTIADVVSPATIIGVQAALATNNVTNNLAPSATGTNAAGLSGLLVDQIVGNVSGSSATATAGMVVTTVPGLVSLIGPTAATTSSGSLYVVISGFVAGVKGTASASAGTVAILSSLSGAIASGSATAPSAVGFSNASISAGSSANVLTGSLAISLSSFLTGAPTSATVGSVSWPGIVAGLSGGTAQGSVSAFGTKLLLAYLTGVSTNVLTSSTVANPQAQVLGVQSSSQPGSLFLTGSTNPLAGRAAATTAGNLIAGVNTGIIGVSATSHIGLPTTSNVIAASVSNIHIGLASWVASHAYNVGDRVANGTGNGNAYQCTIAGQSAASGGPSGTGSDIIDNGAHWKYLSAIDFTDVQSWGNAIPGSPTALSQPYIGYLWNDGPVIWTNSSLPILTLSNHVTSSFNTITLKCAPGESIRDSLKAGSTAFAFNSSKGVSFTLPSTPGNGGVGNNYFDISDANVIFDGIQFKDPLSTSVSSIINVGSSGSVIVRDCILDGYAQANGAAIIGANNTLVLQNSLIVDRQGATDGAVAVIGSGASSNAINNTFVSINASNGAGFLVNAAATARNSIFFGYLNGVGGNGNLVLVDHCLFTGSTVGFATDNGNNHFSISTTNQFVSTSTDFRLLASSDAIGAGAPDTTDIVTADDLTGYARPTTVWSAGAWEARPLVTGAIAQGQSGTLSFAVGGMLAGVTAATASSALYRLSFGLLNGIAGTTGTSSAASSSSASATGSLASVQTGSLGSTVAAYLLGVAAATSASALTIAQQIALTGASASASVAALPGQPGGYVAGRAGNGTAGLVGGIAAQALLNGVAGTPTAGLLNVPGNIGISGVGSYGVATLLNTSASTNISGILASTTVATLSVSAFGGLSGTTGHGTATSPTIIVSEAFQLASGVGATGNVGTIFETLAGFTNGIGATGTTGSVYLTDTHPLQGAGTQGFIGSLVAMGQAAVNGVSGSSGSGLTGANPGANIAGRTASATAGSFTTSSVIATASSNIHIGLTAWQSGLTYSVGDRVSNGSPAQAYQCITSGVSGASGGPSGTGSNITDNAAHWKWLSAIDFTSVQSWANAIPVNLTQPVVGYMWNDGAITLTDPAQVFLSLSGHITTSANTITLTCAPGESFRDRLATGNTAFAFGSSIGVSVTLPNTVGNTNYIDISDAYVIFDGLQFRDPYSASNSSIINAAANTTVTIRNCIFDGYAQANGAAIVGSGSTVHMVNSLVVDRQGATDGAVAVIAVGATSYAVNNTFVSINNSNGAAFLVNNAAAIARNNLFVGYLNGLGGNGNQVLADHCVFTASTVGFGTDNGNNIFNANAANQFVSATSDFRLSYASDALNAASTDLTDLPTATDIAGTKRPQGFAWDIGAWELLPLVSGTGVIATTQAGSLVGSPGAVVQSISALGQRGLLTIIASINGTGTITAVAAASGTASSPAVNLGANPVGASATGATGNVGITVPGGVTLVGAGASGSNGSLASALTVFQGGAGASATAGPVIANPSGLANGVAATGGASMGSIYATVGGLSGSSAAGHPGNTSGSVAAGLNGVSASGQTTTPATSNIIAAATSNIHVGLNAWVTATVYNVGDRVSNIGSAYQCIIGGTSGASGPAGNAASIPDGSVHWKFLSVIDFVTPQAWANSIPAVLSQPYIGYLWNDGAITPPAGQAYLALNNHATSATNTITLTCAPGESFRDSTTLRTTAFAFNASKGVAFTLPNATGSCNYFDIADANVIIDGIQFQDPNPTSNCTIIQGEIGSSNLVVQNCILDGYGQPNGANIVASERQATLRNNLIIDRQATAGTGFAIVFENDAGTVLVNNTIVSINNNTAGVGLLVNTSNVIAVNRNNYFIGYATPITGSGGAVVPTDHCCFSQATFTYANNAVIDNGGNLLGRASSNQFVDPSSDFRTKYSSDGLDAAATDTTDIPSATDISKLARPEGSAWDIGAWELLPLSSGSGAGSLGSAGSLVAAVGGRLSGASANSAVTLVSVVTSVNASVTLAGVVANGAASYGSSSISSVAYPQGAIASAVASGPSVSVPGAVTSPSIIASTSAGSLSDSLTLNPILGTTATTSASSLLATPTATPVGTTALSATGGLTVSAFASIPGRSASGFVGNLSKVITATSLGVAAIGHSGSVTTSNLIAAATANIHVELASWQASHPYTVGARVANGGNAYQCVVAGSSGTTTSPTGTGTNIVDGSVQWRYLSAVDFTDLQSWANAIPVTLTQPYIGYLWNDGAITWTDSNTPVLSLSGHTTTATNTITLTCAPGESIRDSLAINGTPFAFNSSLGASIVLPSTAGNGGLGINYITISDANVILDGLQVKDPLSTSKCSIVFASAGTSVRVQNCIFDGYAQGGGAAIVDADTLQLVNCLVVDRQGATDGAFGVIANTAASYALNSTLVSINNTTGAGFLANAAATVRNCLITGYAVPVGGNGSLVLVDHCVTTAATLTNATDNGSNIFGVSTVNQFLSATSDFRLSYASSAVNAASTDLTDLPAATDIAGTHRPQSSAWDIGAWELTPLVTGMGVAGQSAAGSLIAQPGGQLAGVSAIATASLITVYTGTNASVTLTGLAASAKASLPTSVVQIGIAGVASTAAAGSLGITAPGTASVFGFGATTSTGSLSGSSTVRLIGASATSAAGVCAPSLGAVGNGVTASATAAGLADASASKLSGCSATVATSGLVPTVTPTINGVSAAVIAGTGLTFSNVVAASTSNIHVGLNAWATSTVYNVGDRVANGTNAYQCIQAGTSSVGPSGSGNSISDGTAKWKFLSIIDFTSVQAWANAIPGSPANLAQPYVGYLWNDGPITTTAGTPFLTLNSHNTSSTYTITLTCAPGESFRDKLSSHNTAFAFNSNNGVSFVLPGTTGTTNYFDVTDANVIIDGLQFQDPNPTSQSSIIRNESGGKNFVVQNCIVDGYAQLNVGIVEGGDQIILRNNLIVDRQGSTDGGFAIPIASTATGSILINNTIVSINNSSNGAALIVNAAGVVTINRNNYYMGYATPLGGNAGTVVPTDHCCFSQPTLTYANSSIINNGNNLVGRAVGNQFVNSTTDFRLSYAADGLEAGSSDTTDLPFATDISRTARPQGFAWDIGAWELLPLVSGSGVMANGAAGSLADAISLATLNVSSSGSAGQVANTAGSNPTLMGVLASGVAGTINVPGSAAIAGVAAANGLAGSIATRTDGSASLTGTSAQGVSTIKQANVGGNLRGVSATGGSGTPLTSSVIAAIQSNIHVGLAAWVTGHTYAVGDRVSHVGNAYQCIGGGVSASGPTGTGTSISDGTATFKYLSGIDFTSVQAWADSLPASLGQPYTGYLWNDGPITTTAGTPFLSLQNHATTSANTITLTCAAGESFKDTLSHRNAAFSFNSASGVSFILPSGTGNINYFDIYDANVILDGLQIQDPNPTSNSTLVQGEPAASNLIVQNCILDGYAQSGGANVISGVAQFTLRNSLIIDRQPSNGVGYTITTGSTSGAILINNTVVCLNNNTTGCALLANAAGSVSVNRNNYFIGYTTPIAGNSGGVVPTDHCCFSAANLSYLNSAVIDNGHNLVGSVAANQFVNPTNDFRTIYAADGLDQGYTDTADLPSLVDISTLSRPQGGAWDIGAWELLPLASGSGAAAAGLTGFLTTTASGTATPTSGANGNGGAGGFGLSVVALSASATSSGQAGAISGSSSGKITGRAAITQAGSFTPAVAATVMGLNGVGQTGSVASAVNIRPLGVAAVASATMVATVIGYFGGINGAGAAGSTGSLTTNLTLFPLAGGQASATVGALFSLPGSNLIGSAASSQSGSFAFASSVALTGLVANATAFSVRAAVSTAINGANALGQSGALVAASNLTGAGIAGIAGSFGALVGATVTGATASASVAGMLATQTAFVLSASASGQGGTFAARINAASLSAAGFGQASSAVGDPGGQIASAFATGSAGTPLIQGASLGVLNIIGQTATTQIGSLAPGLSGALISTSAIAQIGVIYPQPSSRFNGTNGTASAGTLGASLLTAMNGSMATVSVGVLGIVALPSGVSGTTLSGSLATATSAAIIGSQAITASGSTMPAVSSGLATVAATISAGSLTRSSTIGVNGSLAVSAAGGLSSPSVAILVTNGVTASSGVSSLATMASSRIAGVTGITIVSTVVPTVNIAITSVVATGGCGSVSLAAKLTLSSVSALGLAGSLQLIGLVAGTMAVSHVGTVALTLSAMFSGVAAITSPAFRRASIGTYFDATGTLQYAPGDTPRFDHSPLSPFPLIGLLIEPASTNLMPRSDLSGWSARNAATLVGGYQSPDGSENAVFLRAANGLGVYDASYSWGGAASTTYTQSVWAKPNGFNYLHMQTWDAGTNGNSGVEAWFDLLHGTVVSATNVGPQSSGASASIVAGPNGFYRCILTGIPATNTTINLQSVLRLSANGSDNTIVGDGVSGLILFGNQVEQSATPSSYIPTSGAAAARAADFPAASLAVSLSRGLITGASGVASIASLIAQPGGLISGSQASSAVGPITAYGISAGLSGVGGTVQSGSLVSSETIGRMVGVGASASGSLLWAGVSGQISGPIAAGAAGTVSNSLAAISIGVAGFGAVGQPISQPMTGLTGISGGGHVGGLNESIQAIFSGVASNGSAGIIYDTNTGGLSGAAATATINVLQVTIGNSVSGVGGFAAPGLLTMTTASVVGAFANGSVASLGVASSLTLSGATALSGVGNVVATTSPTLMGLNANALSGSFGFLLTAGIIGATGVAQAGTAKAQTTGAVFGAIAQASAGLVAPYAGAALSGNAAISASGSLGVQSAVYPTGVSAASSATSPGVAGQGVITATVATAAVGSVSTVKIFAFSSATAAIVHPGSLASQTTVAIVAPSAFSGCGVLGPQPAAMVAGLGASAQAGHVSSGQTAFVSTAAGTALIGSLIPSHPIFPLGVGAGSSVGSLRSAVSVSAFGVAGLGIAGTTRGWLIIISAASAMSMPLAQASVTISPVLDEEPIEISVYAVPQVIQLVYPVSAAALGHPVCVYSLPQLVNTVINDGY